jgi:ATP-dependent Lon protease
MSIKEKPETKRLPMMPIRDVVIFPFMMTPFVVGRDSSVRALEEALAGDKKIFLATQHDASVDEPQPHEIYSVGTVANIVQSLKLPDGNIKVLVEGVERARVVSVTDEDGFFRAVVRSAPAFTDLEAPELVGNDGLLARVTAAFEQYVKISQNLNYETMSAVVRVDDPSKLADTVAANLQLTLEEKQELLEIFSPIDRLSRVGEMLDIEVEKLNMDRSISGRVKRQMERAQKEYYLNEKIKAIQKELGRGEKSEWDEFRKKIEDAGMTAEAHEKATTELRRLEAMPPMSAESTVSRNYLEWLISVPWNKRSEEIRDLNFAQQVLESDHYGLEKIKERIMEFLAVRNLLEKPKGSILCFVGPPGVGKTSLGQSIAKATGRKFVRLSLGGVRDEAEIRGHRRTYIGALPGQLIQMMKKAGTKNPVIMLDEIDKMTTDFRGDPSAALLEVLDPEQNSTFQDHYLDLEYDLSEVFFIATANVLHTIPGPLQDRMEVIRLSGYTDIEKTEIAKRFLVRKQREATGLKEDQLEITDAALAEVIHGYTRESGVRNLEREVGAIARKVARKIVQNGGAAIGVAPVATAQEPADSKPKARKATSKKKDAAEVATATPMKFVVDQPQVEEYLGPARFRSAKLDHVNQIGATNGLAWTEVGGSTLMTEVAVMEGRGKLSITGKLGDVMQESAQAAMSYVRSRASQIGLPKDFYRHLDIHIHVPEGAIPKDGPSAGITLATSIVSALTSIPVRGDVAMTGEISLRGKVLPIGGVKEKLLAAHQHGISEILLPKDNEKDLPDVPEPIRRQLKVHFVQHMDEVLQLALSKEITTLGLPMVSPMEMVAHASGTTDQKRTH